MFNTADSVHRYEGLLSSHGALKRLSEKLDREIRFAIHKWEPVLPSPKPGEIQAAYDPGSEFLTSPEGRRIREAVITKKPPKILRAKGAMAAENVGKPLVTYKVLRPLGEGKVQPYSAPKGKAWITVHRTEIQRGEKFHEQPTYVRNRLNWKNYVRAHVDNQIEGERKRLKMSGVAEPIEETRTRLHKELTQKFLGQTQELYAGERMGKRQLRAATIRHIEGMMKRDRDYMAGGLRQSRAIIHARGADPLLARAHPERMIEYKNRLGALTPLRQTETKSTRGFIVNQLQDIAARGSSVVAEEKDADWMLKRDKLHLHRQMLASPEFAKRSGLTPEKHQERVAEADKALEEHFNLRRTKSEIRDQAKGTIGLLADKPVAHGGSPLSKESAETIAEILQKGNKSGKPITTKHVHRIKSHLDDLYERSASSGIQGVQKELLSRGGVFKRPIKAISSGYPHLRKLGLGLGLTGAVAAGLAVGRAVKRRQGRQQMSSRVRLIQFAKKFGDLPEEVQKILDASINKASMQSWREAEKAAPNIVRSKRLRRRQALVKLKRKWGGEFLKKVLAHPDLPTHPNAPQWKKMFEHQRDINVLQKREQATHAHIRSEALKQQEEILGAQGKERAREEYSRGVGVGREQSRASAQAHYEERAGKLAETMGAESDKRAGRLKWAATGTLAAGALGGYALGRHDKAAHQRHEAIQALNLVRPPRQSREPKAPPSGVTINIGPGFNGARTDRRKKTVQFSAVNYLSSRLIRFQQEQQPDEGPEWLQKWAHKKLYGRDYNTLGQAQRVKKYAGRTHRLVRDLNIKRQGLPNIDVRGRPRKNEWEKPWVAGALTTAGLAGAIFGGKKAVKFIKEAHPQSRIGQLVEGFKRGNVPGVKAKGLAKLGEAYHGAKEELTRWRDKPLKSAAKYEYSKFDPVTGRMKSATQLEREANKAGITESLQEIAARRKIHPWEKGTGEKGFRSLIKEIRFKENDWKGKGWKDNPLYPNPKKKSVQNVPISKIVSHQDAVKTQIVRKYMKKPGKSLPLLHKIGNKYYVEDGNHRIVAKAEQGEKTVRASVREMCSRLREIRFGALENIRQKIAGTSEQEPSPVHDIAVGAVEGGLTFPISAYATKRLLGSAPGLGREMLVGGAVGGAATGLVGAGLGALLRKRRQIRQQHQQMSSRLLPIQFQKPNQRALVARDRYMKHIHDQDIERADRLYAKTALIGAGIGALVKPSTLKRSALKGAIAGAGVQKLARLYGSSTRDQFGERSWTGKRVERTPEWAGTAVLGGYALKRLKMFSLKGRLENEIRFLDWKNSILFEDKTPPPKRKHNVAAGLAIAAAGLPLYKGAGKLARIGLRSHLDKTLGRPMSYGKQVADYIEASQHILNQGVTGKLAGAFLRNPEHPAVKKAIKWMPAEFANLKTGGLNKISREHFSSFRASPTEALQAWSEEMHGVQQKRLIKSTSVEQFRKRQKDIEIHKTQHDNLVDHLSKLHNQGFNEQEALRHVTSDPRHEPLFERLVGLKKEPVKMYTKQAAGLAAIPATAGAAVAATTRKSNDRGVRG